MLAVDHVNYVLVLNGLNGQHFHTNIFAGAWPDERKTTSVKSRRPHVAVRRVNIY